MPENEPVSSKFVLVRNLQKELLMKCLHDIQSPLSGASGYLELMRICINGDKDLFKISRYRNKIQEGLEELMDILLQISYLYKGDLNGDEPAVVEFDLNWLVNEISSNMRALARKREQEIVFIHQAQSVHICADMIVLKLLLYNLMISAMKVAAKSERIEIGLGANNQSVEVQIRINELIRPMSEVLYPFADADVVPATVGSEMKPRFGFQAIQFLNGSIQAERFGGNGAEISLYLPK